MKIEPQIDTHKFYKLLYLLQYNFSWSKYKAFYLLKIFVFQKWFEFDTRKQVVYGTANSDDFRYFKSKNIICFMPYKV